MEKDNVMLNRLQKEGIKVLEHEEKATYFAFHYNNRVFVPKGVDLKKLQSQYSMAHELGHIQQFKKQNLFKTIYNEMSRKNFIPSVQLELFLLWNEWDAWVKGKKICKEEKINIKQYHHHAWHCFKTYLKPSLKTIFKILAYSYLPIMAILRLIYPHLDLKTFFHDGHQIYAFLLGIYETGILSSAILERILSKSDYQEVFQGNDEKQENQ